MLSEINLPNILMTLFYLPVVDDSIEDDQHLPDIVVIKLGSPSAPKETEVFQLINRLRNFVEHTKINTKEIEPDKELSQSEISSESNSDSIEDATMNFEQAILRWGGSCDREAAKVCRNACKDAFSEVCGYYRCSSRMKNRFKWECKRSCDAEFKRKF